MKNSADLGGCYPPPPSASVDNTLLDLQNSSYTTQPHSIIAKYSPIFKTARVAKKISRIIKTIAPILGKNMLGYLSLDIICSSLSENSSALGTNNIRGQISEHIFAPNGDYCLYIFAPHLSILKAYFT